MKLPGFEQAFEYNKWETGIASSEGGATYSATEHAAFLKGRDELADFLKSYGNKTFDNGLYRTHSLDSAIKWTRLLEEYYPEFKEKIRCFGYDWEGNMMVQKIEGKESVVMIFECSTGDYFELEQTITGFHEEDLVDYKDDTIHEEKFLLVTSHLGISSISRNDCIAHRISLLLDGEDVAENMEVTDMEVNWELQQQIMDEINKMP